MPHRAGVIGTGGVGARHVRTYAAADGVDVVALADVDEAALAEAGEAGDVAPEHRYADHVEMLESEPLDAVSVATPTPFHRDHAIDAATRGDPGVVWCEKPVATSVADAEEMVDVFDREGVELVVNHSRRWAPEALALRDLLAEGDRLGALQSVHVTWPLEWLRNGTHAVDLLYFLLPDDVVRASGHLTGVSEIRETAPDGVDVADCGAGAFYVTETGTFVTVDATLPRACSTLRFEFVGAAGKMDLQLRDGEWRYWELTDEGHVEREIPETTDGWSSGVEEYFGGAVDHLVDLLDGEAENRSPGAEATDVLELLVAAAVSAYTDAHVEVPLADPLRDVTVTSW